MKKFKQILTNLGVADADNDNDDSNGGGDDDVRGHLEKGEIDAGAAGEAGAARDATSRGRASSWREAHWQVARVLPNHQITLWKRNHFFKISAESNLQMDKAILGAGLNIKNEEIQQISGKSKNIQEEI